VAGVVAETVRLSLGIGSATVVNWTDGLASKTTVIRKIRVESDIIRIPNEEKPAVRIGNDEPDIEERNIRAVAQPCQPNNGQAMR
jgi:hypothetical protein